MIRQINDIRCDDEGNLGVGGHIQGEADIQGEAGQQPLIVPEYQCTLEDFLIAEGFEVGDDPVQAFERFLSERLDVQPFNFVVNELYEFLKEGRLNLGIVDFFIQRAALKGLFEDIEGRKRFVGYQEMDAIGGEIDIEVDKIVALATDKKASVIDWDLVMEKLNASDRFEKQKVGIVFTGHPVFSATEQYLNIHQQLLTKHDFEMNPLTEEQQARLLKEASGMKIGPEENISLELEDKLILRGCTSWRYANRWIEKRKLERVAELGCPMSVWSKWVPQEMSLADWIWCDVDGRADVRPEDSFMGLLGRKVHFLKDSVDICEEGLANTELHKKMKHDYEVLAKLHKQGWAVVKADIEKGENAEMLQCSVSPIELDKFVVGLIDEAVAEGDKNKVMEYVAFRGDLRSMGLMAARSHFRTNSKNVMAADVESKRSEGPLDQLENHANTRAEDLVRVIEHLLGFIDADTPVRYLVAEAHDEGVLVKLLKLIDKHQGPTNDVPLRDKVQISPLFEDRKGLEKAPETMVNMLEHELFGSYMKCLNLAAIQLGKSDSSRFLGVMSSVMHQEKVMRLMQKIYDSMTKILFITGGMPTMRGMHPRSLKDAWKLCWPIMSRNLGNGSLVIEESLQGGDALKIMLHFMMALNTIWVTMKEINAEPTKEEFNDPFYAEENQKFLVDFRDAVADFHGDLMADQAYAELLTALGTIAAPAGSRKPTRSGESDGESAQQRADLENVRAISHNTMLLSLMFLVTVFGGIGYAANNVEGFWEKFDELSANSPRFRLMMDKACCGFEFSDLEVMLTKIGLGNPEKWDGGARFWVEKHHEFEAIKPLLTKLIDDFRSAQQVFGEFKKIEEANFVPWESPMSESAQELVKMAHCMQTALIKYLYQIVGKYEHLLEPGDVRKILRLEMNGPFSSLVNLNDQQLLSEGDHEGRQLGQVSGLVQRIFGQLQQLTAVIHSCHGWMG